MWISWYYGLFAWISFVGWSIAIRIAEYPTSATFTRLFSIISELKNSDCEFYQCLWFLPRRGYCVEVPKICVRPVSVRPSVRPSVCCNPFWTRNLVRSRLVLDGSRVQKVVKIVQIDQKWTMNLVRSRLVLDGSRVQKWVRKSHNRHFGATLPCGCYLVLYAYCSGWEVDGNLPDIRWFSMSAECKFVLTVCGAR